MSIKNSQNDNSVPTIDQVVASAKAVDRSNPTLGLRYGSSVKLPSSYEPVRLHTSDFLNLYPELSEEIVKKVFEASEALMELYHLFGFERVEVMSHINWIGYQRILTKFRKRMCDFIVLSKDLTSWVAFLKFKTCAFYAFYEEQDRPDPPKGLEREKDGVIFGGRAHKWVRLLKKKNSKLFESFTVSVNLAKKGLPRPTEDMRDEACKKTVRALTSEPYVPEVCSEIVLDKLIFPHAYERGMSGQLTKDVLKFELRRTVKELFADHAYTNAHHYEPFFPSTSANYIRSRGKAGAVGVIMEIISKMKLVSEIPQELVDLDLIEVKARGKLSSHYGQVGIQEDLRSYNEIMMGKEFNEVAIGYDDFKLREAWTELFDLIKILAKDEEPLVEAVALLEALKIRVISKGPPLLYTLLKPMQKFMWRILSENKVFTMISEPITEQHINAMFGRIFPDEVMVNGDYKASTDNLHGYCSEEVVNALVDTLNESEDTDKHLLDETHRELFIRSLTRHIFINPEYDEDEDTEYQRKHNDLAPDFCEEVSFADNRNIKRTLPQKEGQLMGSVTSFPILCIVNATLCRMALEQTNGIRYRMTDKKIFNQGVEVPLVPLYVNGDDCTLKGSRIRNKGLRYNWERITSFGGLSSSVGKTFFSNENRPICVLNSMTYLYESGTWHEVRAINLGILFGLQRSSTESSHKHEYHQLGSLHRDLRAQCPPELWKEASRRFIHYQIDTLKKYPNIPWCAPEYLGGPGLISDEKMSEHDLRACSLLIANMNDPKSKMQVKRCKIVPQWKVHERSEEIIRDRLEVIDHYYEIRPRISVSTSKDYSECKAQNDFKLTHENYEQITNSLTIQQLFKSEHISDLFTHEIDNREKVRSLRKENRTIMKRNMASWKRASEECFKLQFVRTESEILQEQKKLVTPCVRVYSFD